VTDNLRENHQIKSKLIKLTFQTWKRQVIMEKYWQGNEKHEFYTRCSSNTENTFKIAQIYPDYK